ncbi:MAG: Holliday junction resolvase RuvX [Chloroflexi bacterium]|nr:Holliday junction resolvase RuvX [Chloroflexota bacterium]
MAISDELGLYAHARPAILSGSPRAVAEAVARLVDAESITEVVVGLPLTLAGRDSVQTRTARAFAAMLRERLSVPVAEWDERLSSVQAARGGAGAGRKRATGELDSAAAALVLQAVLDARRSGARR